MALFSRSAPPPPPEDDDDEVESVTPEVIDDLPPSRMRGTEPMYGYLVGLELLVVAVLNLVVTGGAGAPKHPSTTLEYAGLAASVVFLGVLQVRNRTLTGFVALGAAFFVTLPKVPSRLSVAHICALAIPLAYALIITQRQRKAVGMSARRGRRRASAASSSRPSRRAQRARKAPEPTGPQRNARYTPPKAKRPTGGRRPSGR